MDPPANVSPYPPPMRTADERCLCLFLFRVLSLGCSARSMWAIWESAVNHAAQPNYSTDSGKWWIAEIRIECAAQDVRRPIDAIFYPATIYISLPGWVIGLRVPPPGGGTLNQRETLLRHIDSSKARGNLSTATFALPCAIR